MSAIKDIEGIGAVYEGKLVAAGVRKTEELLEKGATKKGREALAKETGIDAKLILKWVNHADLFRIKGVGPQYAELLEAAGVDSVPELSKRVPEHLLEKMTETNEKKKLVRALPMLKQVRKWVEQAKDFNKIVTH